MPVTTIENQTAARVLLRLNSGRSWYLGPRETLDVEPVEVKGNAWIRHLEERRVISVSRPEAEPAAAPASEAPDAAAARPRRASQAG
jgi:hypothetical protein